MTSHPLYKPSLAQSSSASSNFANSGQNSKKSKNIWEDDEISADQHASILQNLISSKITPNYKIIYSQKVNSLDVFGGLSAKQNTISDCEILQIKIELPEFTGSMKELDLELKNKSLVLSSSKYYLRIDLPEEVDSKKNCSAKYAKDKRVLTVRAKIIG